MPSETEITLLPEPLGSREQRLPASDDRSRSRAGDAAPPEQGSKLEAAAVLAVGIAFAMGVVFEVSPLNGSLRLTGWQWPWRNDLELLRIVAFLFVPFGLIEFVLRKADERPLSRVSIYVATLATGDFLLQMMGMLAEPEGFGWLKRIVQSPVATSYFTDAQRIEDAGTWLRHFDSASLAFHSSTHPPGPVLFYYAFLKLFGAASGALLGGCAVGFLGSLGVVVAYVFAGLWTDDRRTRLTVCALYALLPALGVFFPEFDQVYPILAMLLIFFWCRSLQSEERVPWEALCLGVVLFAALFFAYNLLAIGAFLAYYVVYWAWRQASPGAALAKILRNSAIAAGVCAGGQTILWLATGYNPIASFRHALAYQKVYASLLHRQYLNSILCDPYDFLLGAGILALPLVAAYLYRVSRDFDLGRRDVALSILGLATILTVDLTGALRGEAARVWLFLQPLLIVPAALELSRFRGRWRTALFAMQWLILACLKAKMLFIRP